MASLQLGCVLFVIALCGMAHSQSCFGRVRTVVPVGPPPPPPPCASCTDDLNALLQLVRALDDGNKSNNSGLNVEELIMKLVNALILTTTSGVSGVSSSSGGSGAGNSGSLIDLGLLGQSANGGLDLANLGLGGTGLLNLGVGGIL